MFSKPIAIRAVVKIGFTHNCNETKVLEGEMIDVCAAILEPNEVKMGIDLHINVQGNATASMHRSYGELTYVMHGGFNLLQISNTFHSRKSCL